MTSAPRILVVGLGNTLRGDDALGRIAAQELRLQVDPQQVRVIDQTAPTPELAAEVAAASLVIFLDASVDGPPDRICTHRLGVATPAAPAAHQLTAPAVLQLARQLYDRSVEAYVITFCTSSFDFGDRCLSPAAERACQAFVAETLALIAQHRASDTRPTPEHSHA